MQAPPIIPRHHVCSVVWFVWSQSRDSLQLSWSLHCLLGPVACKFWSESLPLPPSTNCINQVNQVLRCVNQVNEEGCLTNHPDPRFLLNTNGRSSSSPSLLYQCVCPAVAAQPRLPSAVPRVPAVWTVHWALPSHRDLSVSGLSDTFSPYLWIGFYNDKYMKLEIPIVS